MIADSGPLIVLYKTGLLYILKNLHQEVSIPEAVSQELISKPEGKRMLKENPWIKPKQTKEGHAVDILKIFLDDGEAEAVTLARETKAILLIDEQKGRKIAKELGIRVRGTLGLLVEAKKRGIVKNIGVEIRAMRSKGYYLDDELIKIVLEKAGENGE